MRYTDYTLYRVVDYKTGYHRTVMYATDMNGMYSDRFWDFGFSDVFDVAKTLKIFNEISPTIESVSKTEFKRIFGQRFVL